MTNTKQIAGGIFIQAEEGSGPIEINYLQRAMPESGVWLMNI